MPATPKPELALMSDRKRFKAAMRALSHAGMTTRFELTGFKKWQIEMARGSFDPGSGPYAFTFKVDTNREPNYWSMDGSFSTRQILLYHGPGHSQARGEQIIDIMRAHGFDASSVAIGDGGTVGEGGGAVAITGVRLDLLPTPAASQIPDFVDESGQRLAVAAHELGLSPAALALDF